MILNSKRIQSIVSNVLRYLINENSVIMIERKNINLVLQFPDFE
jgi:hypothetical protein